MKVLGDIEKNEVEDYGRHWEKVKVKSLNNKAVKYRQQGSIAH